MSDTMNAFTDTQVKLRRILCNFACPHSICDCWRGEKCPVITALSPLAKLEAEITKLFKNEQLSSTEKT